MNKDPYPEKSPSDLSLREARQTVAALRVMVDRDPLLSSFLNKAATERRVYERMAAGRPFGLFLIDIDHFKRYNDTYGHIEGDKLLRSLERIMQDTFTRSTDGLESGRIGGDEFLVIMAELGPSSSVAPNGENRTSNPIEQMDSIYNLLCRIEKKLLEYEPRAKEVGVGLSVGSAVFDPGNPIDALVLIAQADEAMYEEKADRS